MDAATATPHARGEICRVRACNGLNHHQTRGGADGANEPFKAAAGAYAHAGDVATLHVGRGDARVRLAAADEALAFEVDLGNGKMASCCPTLEELAKMSGEGRNIVELPLRYASGKEKGYCLLYTSPSPRDQRGSRMPSSA